MLGQWKQEQGALPAPLGNPQPDEYLLVLLSKLNIKNNLKKNFYIDSFIFLKGQGPFFFQRDRNLE